MGLHCSLMQRLIHHAHPRWMDREIGKERELRSGGRRKGFLQSVSPHCPREMRRMRRHCEESPRQSLPPRKFVFIMEPFHHPLDSALQFAYCERRSTVKSTQEGDQDESSSVDLFSNNLDSIHPSESSTPTRGCWLIDNEHIFSIWPLRS